MAFCACRRSDKLLTGKLPLGRRGGSRVCRRNACHPRQSRRQSLGARPTPTRAHSSHAARHPWRISWHAAVVAWWQYRAGAISRPEWKGTVVTRPALSRNCLCDPRCRTSMNPKTRKIAMTSVGLRTGIFPTCYATATLCTPTNSDSRFGSPSYRAWRLLLANLPSAGRASPLASGHRETLGHIQQTAQCLAPVRSLRKNCALPISLEGVLSLPRGRSANTGGTHV